MIIIISCNKDENYTSSENEINHEEKHQEYITKHLSTNINTYLPDYNPQSSTSNLEVPIEMLRDIKSSIESMDMWGELSLVIQGYGAIRWNWSALNITNGEQYIVMLPILDNNRITAILRYLHVDEHYHIEVITYGHIVDVTQNFTYYDITNDYLPYINMFNSLNYYSNWTINTKMNDWISSYIKNNPNMIVNKNFLADATEEVCTFERTLEPIAGGSGEIAYHIVFEKVCEDVAIQVNVPCGGGPPRPFPPFNRDTFNLNTIPPIPPMPPSPSGSENEGETEENEEVDPVYPISDTSCVRKYMTPQSLNMIESMIDVEFPCEDITKEDIIDAIIEELCANAASAEQGVAGLDGPITTNQIIEAMSKFDKLLIINERPSCGETEGAVMSDDCPKLYNILNSLSGNDGSSTMCSMFEELDQNETADIQFLLDCSNDIMARGDGSRPLGQVNLGDEDIRQLTIHVNFNTDLCDSSCVKILSVVIHETLHARMHTRILNEIPPRHTWPESDPPTTADANAAWARIRAREYDSTESSHRIMARFYAEEYAKTMANYFNHERWEDFLFWAYDGLAIPIDDPVLPSSKWETISNDWNNIKDEINATNCE